MKNLFFALGLGLTMIFSTAAIAQDNNGNAPKKENNRSNGKANADRKFGKERAGTVQEMNGQKREDLGEDPKKAQKKAEKQARKEDRERMKYERKMVKKNKTKK